MLPKLTVMHRLLPFLLGVFFLASCEDDPLTPPVPTELQDVRTNYVLTYDEQSDSTTAEVVFLRNGLPVQIEADLIINYEGRALSYSADCSCYQTAFAGSDYPGNFLITTDETAFTSNHSVNVIPLQLVNLVDTVSRSRDHVIEWTGPVLETTDAYNINFRYLGGSPTGQVGESGALLVNQTITLPAQVIGLFPNGTAELQVERSRRLSYAPAFGIGGELIGTYRTRPATITFVN